MVNQTLHSRCYEAAMRLLVRREHSVLELKQKLFHKIAELDEQTFDRVIEQLIDQNFQSDERFASEFIQMRFNQGKGPKKIAMELKQRGVENFDLSVFDFFALAKQVKETKFGKTPPKDYKEKAKQQRFMQSRGFDFEQINQVFNHE